MGDLYKSTFKMNSDWHHPFTFFGYEIQVPNDMTYRKFIHILFDIESIIDSPFKITGILSEFHNRIDDIDEYERDVLDDLASVVIGFYPVNDLNKMVEMHKQLTEYITDNPVLVGLDITKCAKFYCGIDWFYRFDGESDEDDESDESDEDDESDESDEDDDESDESDESDEEEDNDESDEDSGEDNDKTDVNN
jgi:hypothetical protein